MKVLVLSGRFGMGHEMAANAICEQFRKLDKDTEIVKKDLLEELYPHISKLIFGGFRLMVEHCHPNLTNLPLKTQAPVLRFRYNRQISPFPCTERNKV